MEINREQLEENIENILKTAIVAKIIFSSPTKKDLRYKKVVFENKIDRYMINSFTEKQSFTTNIPISELTSSLNEYLKDFKQCNIFTNSAEYLIKVSKKGKIFFSKNILEDVKFNLSNNNNREKNYIFKEGQIIQPLIDMGIYTSDGHIVKSMYDKYKQINKFIELIDDYIKDNNLTKINIVDFGCGKSYLTFLVYYYFKFIKNIDINMIGLDLKEDVIKKCNEVAKKYNYSSLRFELGDINGYKPDMDVDMIITLHACDRATDYALFNAIKWNVKMIFSVPCCQHEVNEQIKTDKLPILTRYGLIKERISSDFTDIVRCNLLKAMSYDVNMVDFVGFEHTPKNILIRAIKTKIPLSARRKYLKEVIDLKTFFNFEHTLCSLLKNDLEEI